VPKAMAPSANTEPQSNVPAVAEDKTTPLGEPQKLEQEEPKQEEAKKEETPVQQEVTKNNTIPLTFAQVVPAIVKQYNLKVPAGSVAFANIATTSPLYNAFKA
jgi:hypothetical protein